VPGDRHRVKGGLEALLGAVELHVHGGGLAPDRLGEVLAVQAAQVQLDEGAVGRLQPVGGR
jgi:hypothetical protein